MVDLSLSSTPFRSYLFRALKVVVGSISIITVLSFAFSTFKANAQFASTPEPLRGDLSIRKVMEFWNTGFVVRVAHDPSTDDLYILTLGGDLLRLAPPYDDGNVEHVYGYGEARINGRVSGIDISQDGKIFLVGSEDEDPYVKGVVVRGTPIEGGRHHWEIVMKTTPYPKSGTAYDHFFNAVVFGPSQTYLYVSSGSRTDHGEVQDYEGQFPGIREVEHTSAIFEIPSFWTDVELPNETIGLGGILYADGLRNSFDLAFNDDAELFAIDNSGDRDDNDELNRIYEGHHYGFPWRMGDNDNPQQFPDYDPDEDPLLFPEGTAVMAGYYHNDPEFPDPPNVPYFDVPVANLGPDANLFRNPSDGTITDGDTVGTAVYTFTPHRSPLGLVFDRYEALPGIYKGKGFVLSWSDPERNLLLNRFGDEGEDLLLLDIDQVGDFYEARVDRLIKGFNRPIDAEIVGDKLYVLDFDEPRTLWEVSFAENTSVETTQRAGQAFDLQLYPNPVVDTAMLTILPSSSEEVEVSLYNVLGQYITTLHTGVLSEYAPVHVELNTSSWPAGAYFIQVAGKARTERMMFQVY